MVPVVFVDNSAIDIHDIDCIVLGGMDRGSRITGILPVVGLGLRVKAKPIDGSSVPVGCFNDNHVLSCPRWREVHRRTNGCRPSIKAGNIVPPKPLGRLNPRKEEYS
jgi:hypothetical protein